MEKEIEALADRLEALGNQMYLDDDTETGGALWFHANALTLITEQLRALASRAGGWISVQDRLPGVCDHVEVYPDPRDETYCFYAHHDGGMNGVKAGRWYFNDRDGYDYEIKVTHWRYETAAPEPVAVGSNNSTNDEER